MSNKTLFTRLLDACLVTLSGVLLMAATPGDPVGNPVVVPAESCETTVTCQFGLPMGGAAANFDFAIVSITQEICKCDGERGAQECVPDPETKCSFDIKVSMDIPNGKSIKYNGECYKTGDSGPDNFRFTGSGCGSAFVINFTLYNNTDCTGNGTPQTAGGACAFANSCSDQRC